MEHSTTGSPISQDYQCGLAHPGHSLGCALMAALVLRSERESTAILHHLNLIALNLQNVLSDLADAQGAEREYLLTGRSSSLENLERSRDALGREFDRL